MLHLLLLLRRAYLVRQSQSQLDLVGRDIGVCPPQRLLHRLESSRAGSESAPGNTERVHCGWWMDWASSMAHSAVFHHTEQELSLHGCSRRGRCRSYHVISTLNFRPPHSGSDFATNHIDPFHMPQPLHFLTSRPENLVTNRRECSTLPGTGHNASINTIFPPSKLLLLFSFSYLPCCPKPAHELVRVAFQSALHSAVLDCNRSPSGALAA